MNDILYSGQKKNDRKQYLTVWMQIIKAYVELHLDIAF